MIRRNLSFRPRDKSATVGHRGRGILVATLLVLVTFLGATAAFMVWSRRDVPSPADAIVVFGGNGPREAEAVQLAQRGLAPMLVFSEADPPREPVCRLSLHLDDDKRYDPLQPEVMRLYEAGLTVICFRPTPSTTQGESEAVARLAVTYRWKRILLVVSRPQATRARLRLRRCYKGGLGVESVSIPWRSMPWTIAYEWGALLKALVIQRAC